MHTPSLQKDLGSERAARYVKIAAALFLAQVCADFILALCGLTSIQEARSGIGDLAWGFTSVITSILLFLGSGSGLIYLLNRMEAVANISILLLTLALVGEAGVLAGGVMALRDASHRGGDWGGLDVLASFLFQILFPLALGVMAGGGLFCLRALRAPGKAK